MRAYVALIILLILDHPLCPTCIAAQTQLNRVGVTSRLLRIGRSVAVRRSNDEGCRACGNVGDAVAIAGDDLVPD